MKIKRNSTMKAYWNGISGSGSRYIVITDEEAAQHPGRNYINLYWCQLAERYVTIPENDGK